MNIIEEVMKPYDEFCEYLENEVFKDFHKVGDKNESFKKKDN